MESSCSDGKKDKIEIKQALYFPYNACFIFWKNIKLLVFQIRI